MTSAFAELLRTKRISARAAALPVRSPSLTLSLDRSFFPSSFPLLHFSSPFQNERVQQGVGQGADGQAFAPPVSARWRAAPSPSRGSIVAIMKSKDSLAVTSWEKGRGIRSSQWQK